VTYVRCVVTVPHPIPYQGSKRKLAAQILLALPPDRRFEVLYEPFAGSAAFTLAAAQKDIADRHVIADLLPSLDRLWQKIISAPDNLASEYEALWNEQLLDPEHFARVRRKFNEDGGPVELLYLLARCVKNAPRFNGEGKFNQSHDKRRTGKPPKRMTTDILGANALLAGRSDARSADFEHVLEDATAADLVFLDPPYEGTTSGRDKRYFSGLRRSRLIEVLDRMNRRDVPVLLTYDGRTGTKRYGEPLHAESLGLVHLELHAGRSSQSTLLGRSEETVESLYVSRSLFDQLSPDRRAALGPAVAPQ
jgi:DNA adenine methylase